MFKLRVPVGFPSNRCSLKHSRLAWGPWFSFSTSLNMPSQKRDIAMADVRLDCSIRKLRVVEELWTKIAVLRSVGTVAHPCSCTRSTVETDLMLCLSKPHKLSRQQNNMWGLEIKTWYAWIICPERVYAKGRNESWHLFLADWSDCGGVSVWTRGGFSVLLTDDQSFGSSNYVCSGVTHSLRIGCNPVRAARSRVEELNELSGLARFFVLGEQPPSFQGCSVFFFFF